jgi:hypothetical protein
MVFDLSVRNIRLMIMDKLRFFARSPQVCFLYNLIFEVNSVSRERA